MSCFIFHIMYYMSCFIFHIMLDVVFYFLDPVGSLVSTLLIERILIQSFSEFLIRNSEFLHTSAVWKYVGGGGRGLGAGGVAGVAGGGPEHGRHRRLQVHQPRRWHFALR